jgi:hypothetical protein
MKPTTVLGVLLVVAFATMINTVSADESPAWQLALQQQLLSEKQCNLNYLTNVKKQTLGAIESIEARAHCMNGEAYDIKSMHGTQMFEIRECGITIC